MFSDLNFRIAVTTTLGVDLPTPRPCNDLLYGETFTCEAHSIAFAGFDGCVKGEFQRDMLKTRNEPMLLWVKHVSVSTCLPEPCLSGAKPS